jgi:hypothetical protein
VLLINNDFIIITGGRRCVLTGQDSWRKVIALIGSSQDMANYLGILLIQGRGIKDLSLSHRHFLLIVYFVVAQFMSRLGTTCWAASLLFHWKSVLHGSSMFSVASASHYLHWPLGVTRNLLYVPSIGLQELGAPLSCRNRFAHAHRVILWWGLLRSTKGDFLLHDQVRRLCAIVFKDILRYVHTNFALISDVYPLIHAFVSNSLALSGRAVVLLVEVNVLLMLHLLVLKTVRRVHVLGIVDVFTTILNASLPTNS